MYCVGRYSLCGVMNATSTVPNSGEPPEPQKPTITFDSASLRAAASVIEVPLPSSKNAVFFSGMLKNRSISSPRSVR